MNIARIDMSKAPFIPRGCRLVENHTSPSSFVWSTSLYSHKSVFFRYDIEHPLCDGCSGHMIRAKHERTMFLNACVLDRLLTDVNLIPKSWHSGEFFEELCFWGSIYSTPIGGLFVRTLRRADSWWEEHYRPLLVDFQYRHPALVMSK